MNKNNHDISFSIINDIVRSVKEQGNSVEVNPIRYDKNYRDANDNQHIIKRNKQYTSILKKYTLYLDSALNFKSKLRKFVVIFFMIILGIVILVLLLFIGYIIFNKDFNITTLVAFVTASGTLISTLLIIPTKIAEFIFNRDEEKYMSEIIKNIQDYDKNVRNGLCTNDTTENNDN